MAVNVETWHGEDDADSFDQGELTTGADWIHSRQRRAFEIAVVSGGMVSVGGIALSTAAAIAAIEGPSAVLRKEERSLVPGRTFDMYKLGDPERGGAISRLCVRTMIDESPQAISILRGTMSLFGPRAYPDEITERLYESVSDPGQARAWQEVRQQQKGGIISSYSNKSHRRNLHGSHVNKLVVANGFRITADTHSRMDIDDFEKASFNYDLRLLADTIRMIGGNYKKLAKLIGKKRG